MDELKFVVFFISRSGKQVFHICPPSLQAFYDDYEQKNKGGDLDILLNWIDEVPTTLKSKINEYPGYFIDFNELPTLPKLKEMTQVVMKGIMPVSKIFNPFAMAKRLAASSSLAARGMN